MSRTSFNDLYSTSPYHCPPEEFPSRFPAPKSRRPASSPGLLIASSQTFQNSASRQGSSIYDVHPLSTNIPGKEQRILCPYILNNPHLPPKSADCWTETFQNASELRQHIEHDHGLHIRAHLSGLTEREKFVSIWMELFPNHHGQIPPPNGWSRDDFRRQQNFRTLEIHERQIMDQVRRQEIVTPETLQNLFDDFRRKTGGLLLPDNHVPERSVEESSSATFSRRTFSRPVSERVGPPIFQRDTFSAGTLNTETATIRSSDTRGTGKTPGVSSQNRSSGPSTDVVESVLTPLKRTIVDRLMSSFKEMAEPNSDSEDEDEESSGFDSNGSDPVSEIGYREDHGAKDAQESLTNAGEPSSRARNGSNGSNESGQDGQLLSVPDSRSLNQRGKRRTRDSSAAGNSERGGGKRRRGPPTPGESESAKPSLKFACPFFKHDPEKPHRITSCCFPGFASVSRVKEHIYRTHPPLNQCARCFEAFDSEERLDEHMRSEERCPKRQEKPKTENINIQQERKLRCKKNVKDMAEYERWKQVYRIIFDLGEGSETPSPYLDQCTQNFQIFSRYEQFSRESLPRLLRTELEQAVQRDAQAIEAQLRSQLVTIVQRCQETLFSMFRESEESLSNPITDANRSNRNLEMNLPTEAFEPPNAARSQEEHAASVEQDAAVFEIPEVWDFNWLEAYTAGNPMQ